ncbi:MAG TPA: fimbrillin family protein [Bacteroidales bacterium]|nr:fimbrillin family protein [Bacteroidales bacterium]
MHRNHFLYVSLFILSGCSVQKAEPELFAPINFSAVYGLSVDITTKASIYDIDQMEPIQILRSDGTAANYSAHTAPDLTGTVAADGTVTPSVPQYYDLSGAQANFMAFYPVARTILNGKANFKITGQEDVTAAQNVYAGSSGSPSAAAFAFRHLLAQVRIQVCAQSASDASSWGTITYLKIETPTSLNLNLNAWPALSAASNPENEFLPTSIGNNASQTITTTYASAGSLMILNATYPLQVKVKTANKAEQTVTTSIWYLGIGNVYTIKLFFKNNSIELQ